jgi:hypothetical protein
MSIESASDYITKLSQTQSKPLDSLLDPFPEIPDPPLGWNPEKSPVRTNSESASPPDYLSSRQEEPSYIPQAKVYLITEDGNPDFEEVLRRGARGDIIICKKEVVDMKGSVAFKAYIEWLEIPESMRAKKQST